jgi:hypothetical protein
MYTLYTCWLVIVQSAGNSLSGAYKTKAAPGVQSENIDIELGM